MHLSWSVYNNLLKVQKKQNNESFIVELVYVLFSINGMWGYLYANEHLPLIALRYKEFNQQIQKKPCSIPLYTKSSSFACKLVCKCIFSNNMELYLKFPISYKLLATTTDTIAQTTSTTTIDDVERIDHTRLLVPLQCVWNSLNSFVLLHWTAHIHLYLSHHFNSLRKKVPLLIRLGCISTAPPVGESTQRLHYKTSKRN